MVSLESYKSGKYHTDRTGYKYFIPSEINQEWQWENQMINSLIEKAAIKLGELNSYSKLVPNIDLFLQLYITKEAVVSSRIEGTQTNFNEALLKESEVDPERRDDWLEVRNYIYALNTGISSLKKLPISSRLLNSIHKILMQGVRGEKKMPGQFRSSQNWIGGMSPMDAVFVPPRQDLVPSLMNDLEKFIHNNEFNVPDLIKIAIVHYQFETIHPYLDGNGRIGRLLITLMLIEKNILSQPLLYLSTYFEKEKSLYYDNLTFVRTRNDMTQWIKYFLVGIAKTAEESSNRLSAVLELKSDLEKQIMLTFGRRTDNALKLLNYLFINPIFLVVDVQSQLSVSYKSANSMVNKFHNDGIIRPFSKMTRNRMFEFHTYLDLFNE
jgi:Fic family protein